jgi:hypothetical protein
MGPRRGRGLGANDFKDFALRWTGSAQGIRHRPLTISSSRREMSSRSAGTQLSVADICNAAHKHMIGLAELIGT